VNDYPLVAPVRPRNWLVAPEFFGERIDAQWKRHLKSQETDVALAYLQHRLACAVQSSLGHSRRTTSDFASALGDQTDTLRRKLNGYIRITLEDLLKWAMEVGVDVVPLPQDRSELLPPPDLVRS
jgi:hypothetical protein